MPSQIGLIKIKGTMDGLSFYEQNDGTLLVRKAKGPSKERLLTDPKFKRTRENMAEFSGSAKAARGFRRALGPASGFAGKRFAARTLSVYKAINLNGDGKRGKRTIDVSLHRAMLNDFQLNPVNIFEETLKSVTPVTNHNDARITAQVVLPAIDVERMVKTPPGATHFRLLHAIGLVSDYAFDETTGVYQPVEPTIEGVYASTYSDYFSADEAMIESFTLTASLQALQTVPPRGSVVQGLGIEFAQQRKGNYYPIKGVNAFRIVDVF